MTKLWRSFTILVFLVLSGAVCAYSAEFSADMITTSGGQVVQSTISVKGQKSRIEMPQMTIINRGDLGVAWMVMPTEGMYMEHPLDPKMLAQAATEAQGETEREAMGKDTIDGQSFDKFKVTYKTANHAEIMYQWIGPNNIPVKAAALDDSWTTEYRNIKTGGINESTFELPDGMQKMQMPVMPGNLGQ